MVETVTESDYAKHTVSELKEELKSKGLKVSGNKSELISRLVADLNETIQNLENVIEETEEAAEAIEAASEELGDVSDKISERDLKGTLTELKDASDELEEAAEETLEAADSALVAAEDISEKASVVALRWGALSRNQKVIVAIITVATVAFVASGYQF